MNVLRISSLAVSAAWMLACGSAQAALTTYTTKSAFDVATAALGARQTVDFETTAPGTTIPSGGANSGLIFSYSIAGGLTLVVADTFDTTSGSNYLGLNNPDTAFYLGDSVTIDFGRSINAVGLFVIAGTDAQAGDIELSIATGTVANGAAPENTLGDGGRVYYLGLFDSGNTFSSATLRGIPAGGAFLAFTADDITSAAAVGAVPEPGTLALVLAGLGLPWSRRRRP